MLLEKVTLEDKIGQLFIVDIKFDYENPDAKQIRYNEIYPSVVINRNNQTQTRDRYFNFVTERDRQGETDRETDRELKSYRATKKSQATLIPKTFIPLYLEHMRFLISRCRWMVAQLYRNLNKQQKMQQEKIFISY